MLRFLIAWSIAVSALYSHTRSESFSTWNIKKNGKIEATFSITRREATRIPGHNSLSPRFYQN